MAGYNYPPVIKGSLRAMAYEIRNGISGGIASDDSKYSLRLIENEIKHQLGLAQKEEDVANEILGISPSTQRVQVFSCLPMKETKDFSCKCTSKGGKFKKVTLPKMLQYRGQSYITFMGNTDTDLSFVPANNIQYLNSNVGFIKKPMYFLAGNAAYVSLPPDFSVMCEATVMGIPDDPSETNGLCFDVWQKDWNVPEYMKAIVKARVMQIFAPALVNSGQNRDIRNNASEGNEFVTISTP